MQNYTKFRDKEWSDAYSKANRRFSKEVLGARPLFEEVRKEIPNPHVISLLEWAAMVVLIVVAIFTSFKVGALAVPFATKSMQALTQHTFIDPVIQNAFTVVTAILFMLLATPSLIYFKLLDKEPEIVTEKRETRDYGWFSMLTLDYITPRLPYLMVYASLAWLIYTSSQIPGTPFEQYLPVLAEIALAALVGNILKKRQAFDTIVYDALRERTEPYDKRKADHDLDPQFLRILYQVIREDLTVLVRKNEQGKRIQPNAWMENASAEEVDPVIVAEYRRKTGGMAFASIITKAETDDATIVSADVVPVSKQRVPPKGEAAWTPDTLWHDLRVRGVKKPYGEAELSRDYAPNFGARSAWRKGARAAFEA